MEIQTITRPVGLYKNQSRVTANYAEFYRMLTYHKGLLLITVMRSLFVIYLFHVVGHTMGNELPDKSEDHINLCGKVLSYGITNTPDLSPGTAPAVAQLLANASIYFEGLSVKGKCCIPVMIEWFSTMVGLVPEAIALTLNFVDFCHVS